MSLREGCKEVLKADCVDLEERLYRGQQRGIKVEDEVKCAICAGNITSSKPSTGIVAFFCHHIYHQKCLRSGSQTGNDSAPITPDSPMKLNEEEKLWCTICQNLKQAKKKSQTARTQSGSTATRKLGLRDAN